MAGQLALVLMAILAGVTAPVQAGVNAQLRTFLGSALAASFVSFLVGTVALAAVLLLKREAVPFGPAFAQAPWWTWCGGFLGAFFVTVTIVAAPRLGAATTMALFVTGQMVASLIMDHFALVGYPENPATPMRMVGVVLLIAGVVLIRGF